MVGKEDTIPTREGKIDEKLMKPFSLGWTREVVKRVLARKPTCDIYYFSPNGKKIRSLNEVKSQITDGLTPDCFSFKREILGVELKFETVRDAKHKTTDKTPQKRQASEKKPKTEEPEPGSSGVQLKKRKIEVEKTDSSLGKDEATEGTKSQVEEKQDEIELKNDKEADSAEEMPSQSPVAEKRLTRNTLSKAGHSKMKKKSLKGVMCKQRRRSRMLGRQKVLGKAKVATPNSEKAASISEEETELKNKNRSSPRKNERTSAKANLESKNNESSLRSRKSTRNTSAESEKKNENDEGNSKTSESAVQNTKGELENAGTGEGESKKEEEDPGRSDLKTIVQKNIGKYRKLREKEKLNSVGGQKKRIHAGLVNNSRAESFLKNKHNYLKPLQKGWRRELVYRSSCSKAGLQADVYYFHPSGKKFRSSREILEHPALIAGLPIEFFTFRKEAVGCGEPQEIIRNARRPQK